MQCDPPSPYTQPALTELLNDVIYVTDTFKSGQIGADLCKQILSFQSTVCFSDHRIVNSRIKLFSFYILRVTFSTSLEHLLPLLSENQTRM